MDPDKNLSEIFEAIKRKDVEMRRFHADYLIEWIQKGGFYPPSWKEHFVTGASFRRWLRQMGTR